MTAVKRHWRTFALTAAVVAASVGLWIWTRSPTSTADPARNVLDAEREVLLETMARDVELMPDEVAGVRAIVFASNVLSQGNPHLTEHPMTREECRRRRSEAEKLEAASPRCGKPNMVAAFDPERGETAEAATLCVDQYEFPNVPCEYPVVHVRAREAALLCQALGKRLCDAHEWEGACAGAVRAPEMEYAFGKSRSVATRLHNTSRERVWATKSAPARGQCAMGSGKTEGCGGGFARCGSNTYPAGAFPECVSRFGVYDQHGNVAEHMNLPMRSEQLGGEGGLGQTEMKGSWFIWDSFEAHEDDCRWRAKDWHPSRVRDADSHRNYHLGFRCCLDLGVRATAASATTVAHSEASASTSLQQRNPVE
jgi:hypothetical protein